MFKALVGFAASALIIGPAAMAKAATHSQAQCSELHRRYGTEIDTASRYQALNQALGERAGAANEAKESNALTRSNIALQALKNAGCKTKTLLPSPGPYMPSANGCKLNTIMSAYGEGLPTTCDPTKWKKANGLAK